MEAPHEDHLATVKRVLRYVARTKEHGLHYAKHEEGRPTLVGYCDADMAGDIDDCKSTSGALFFLGSNLITWELTKQRVMALSSCEAEYIVAATACQGVWLAWLLTDLIGAESGALELCIDNQSVIALCRNPVFHDRSKHIDVRYHFIWECVEEERIIIIYTVTMEQLADILTMVLGRIRFQELSSKIGIL
jgi:hypothetical protein